MPWLADITALNGPLFASEAYAQWKEAIEAAPEKMFGPVLVRFRGGAQFSAVAYIQARQMMMRMRRAWAAAVDGFDAVLMATSPITPPPIDRLLQDDEFFTRENLLTLRNTRIGNLMGVCGLTLPTGVPSAGLTLLGPAFGEARLLRLGAAVERTLA
jgi:aspartyl-tRNA(Asn)/glutamyl-tRNA(Gln) amidotransferase subunit A